jgi:cyclophilin family peptidyl-prolyl cis-trans isomerase
VSSISYYTLCDEPGFRTVTTHMKTLIIATVFGVATLALESRGQSPVSRVTTAADRALLTELVAREDSRQPIGPRDARTRGLAATNPFLRAFTVRGLGRLESPAVLSEAGAALGDPSAEVRAAAAEAVAQSVVRPTAASSVDSARAMLSRRLDAERDPSVRAALLESIGRLPQGSVERVKATANVIAPSLSAASVVERRGAIRGIFFLARKREARAAGVIPTPVTDRLYAMLDEPPIAGFTPTDRFNMAFALWGAVALDDVRSHRLFADRETFVRERGIVNLARSNDLPLIRAHMEKTMADPEPVIRFRSIGVYAQKLRAADGCGPLVALTRDTSVTVALAATDALSGCRDDASVISHLRSLAEDFRDDDRWHLSTHAFVSLSVLDSAAGRALLPRFMAAKNFFVRMYADTAARLMKDVASLYTLSRDVHANVQASAIEGLSRLVGHAADSIYIRALGSDDNQVLMAAAAALKGTTQTGVRELAFDRWQARGRRGWDTDVDGQTALIDLYRALGGSATPAVYERVPMALPTFDDLAALERATAHIEMADGSNITMKLHPLDAPTNAFRFARLARAGTFDGLTFHRVAPFFVVQGPGPNANEYSAPDKPFAREELALSNVRGSVGLSTRGRDTGDGQIYVNTVDNVWLDHEFTVMGTITSGLEAFDRMQEGARIRRVTITP